ncbi:hypothetical protein E1281_31565, partial [Actinomadura sp. KC345]|uniref:hypothetical protein n=1 Tax=Actinomadura sp. KC345 TaxID=2530371 RepID=UPI001052CA0C
PDDPHQPHTVTDQLDGATYTWHQSNYVYLDPRIKPAHILTFEQNGSAGDTATGRKSARKSTTAKGGAARVNGTAAKSRRSSPRAAAAERRRSNGS